MAIFLTPLFSQHGAFIAVERGITSYGSCRTKIQASRTTFDVCEMKIEACRTKIEASSTKFGVGVITFVFVYHFILIRIEVLIPILMVTLDRTRGLLDSSTDSGSEESCKSGGNEQCVDIIVDIVDIVVDSIGIGQR